MVIFLVFRAWVRKKKNQFPTSFIDSYLECELWPSVRRSKNGNMAVLNAIYLYGKHRIIGRQPQC